MSPNPALWGRCLAVAAALAGFVGTSIMPSAGALPPAGFPDLNNFREVADDASFVRADPGFNGYLFFRTPDGITCAMGSSKWCSGNLPGVPESTAGSCAFVEQTNDEASRSQPFKFDHGTNQCEPPSDKLLNVGEKLTGTYGTTCVVGEGSLTACIDTWHDHGFVLQPSGSWTF
jgi:hypothetical protein